MCMFCRSLLVLFLLVIVLSVLLYTDSDYPFRVFKLFIQTRVILTHLIWISGIINVNIVVLYNMILSPSTLFIFEISIELSLSTADIASNNQIDLLFLHSKNKCNV